MRARAQVSVRSGKALAAAAAAVVLAAALATAGLAAGTRAAAPDDLGQLTQHGVSAR